MNRASIAAALLSLTVACGGAASGVVKVSEAERTRAALLGQDAQVLAPQAFAEADQALRAAKEADRAGDQLAAELHAERAVAAYEHALGLARLARATEEEARASEALGRGVEQSQRYAASRRAAEREVDDLEKQLRVAREAERPSTSLPASAEREKARLVAAQSLAMQARLLCSAARLVSASATGLAEAETQTTELEKALEGTPRSSDKTAPIDQAARARAACLGALTKARRSGAEKDPADALLGELSRARLALASGEAKAHTAVAPVRDERGVVVTLRSIFKADQLSAEGKKLVEELGRIAAAHPDFALQVVIHDATTPTSEGTAQNTKRGDAITKALTDAGAAKTKVEQAGAKAPVFNPNDAQRKAQNARIEIVFVGAS